jgi:4-amino-4-deoxy-L-arabinose transferase-like glycosyltransferase
LPRLWTSRGACLFATALTYGAGVVLRIFRSRPGNNEAWFANPAVDLLVRHKMGTPVVEGVGTWLAGIDQHTYWTMPLYSLVQVPWYWLFGFSLLTQRLLTSVLGIGVLFCVYALVKKLSTEWAAVLSVVFIGCDYEFIKQSAEGRMDMLCAFLGFAGLALYLNLRETNFRRAVLLSNVAAAASCMTHPCGVLAMTGLWAIMFYFDRKRLGWKDVALAGAPYVVALALWAAYILPAPASFLAQMKGNARGIQAEIGGGNRFNLMLHPRWAFKTEMGDRYIGNYYSAAMPGVYLIGLLAIVVLAWRTRRKDHVAIALIASLYFLELMLLEGTKREQYLVHSVPMLSIALAVVLCSIELPRRYRTATVVAAAALVVTIQGVTMFRHFPTTVGVRNYFATEKFLEANYVQGTTLIAPAEFAYRFGFYGGLIDDWRIGYYSGKSPEFIVAGPLTLTDLWLKQHRNDTPEFAQFVTNRLGQEYVVVMRNANYTVYVRRERAASLTPAVSDPDQPSMVRMVLGLHPPR